MRRKEQRLSVDTLFILGAGSSRALSYVKQRDGNPNSKTTPLDTDFLSLMNINTPRRGWQKKSIELLESSWLDNSDFWQGGLERSIIDRVAHFDMLSAIHKDKARRKVSNSTYLNHLSHLITEYLWKCQSNNSGATRRFVEYVYPKGVDPKMYKNRIVSFNYDLLIDRPLLDRGLSRQKLYFDSFHDKRDDVVKRGFREGFDNPLLLKLHGSLNWRSFQGDFERIINGELKLDEKIPVWESSTKLPSPEDDESPLIIPPIPNKPITRSRLFRHLWTRFLEYLSEAKTIVVVGYSCPETDVMARSIFSQFTNKTAKNIFIVDPSSTAINTFVEIMRPRVSKKMRWHYCVGFDEYLENELKLTKTVKASMQATYNL